MRFSAIVVKFNRTNSLPINFQGNEQDTPLPREAQASNDLPVNVVQWESEVTESIVNLMYKSCSLFFIYIKFEEDAFLQEAVRENESDNSNLSVKNIYVRNRMENWRKFSKYIPEIHKQEYVFLNVIVFFLLIDSFITVCFVIISLILSNHHQPIHEDFLTIFGMR